MLKIELGELREEGFDLALTGFAADEIDKLLAAAVTGDESAEDDLPAGDDAERGSLLSRLDITIAEPSYEVQLGDHFMLGDRHHLLCAGVMRDWGKWRHLLTEDAIFCPYPGPFAVFGSAAGKHPLNLVQPDPYIAGHILDRFEDVHGASSIKKVTQ